ncbi:MAG: hypothetical protein FWE03_04250 [Firmicutes bacterium]|nr:hypothetical protein [Bacillota bacterium]
MEKNLEYNLNIGIGEKFPFLPVLHDYKVDEIKIEDKRLIIVSNDVANHDDDSSNFSGIKAKSVKVEFINNEYGTDMSVDVIFHGKKNKVFLYCEEFLDAIKEYDNLEILYPMVGFRQVHLMLFGAIGKKRCNITMKISCDKVKYTFTE